MTLSKIEIKNFMSYQNQSLELDKGLNCFIGPNGAGKSNLFEAFAWALIGPEGTRLADKNLSFKYGKAKPSVHLYSNLVTGDELEIHRSGRGCRVSLNSIEKCNTKKEAPRHLNGIFEFSLNTLVRVSFIKQNDIGSIVSNNLNSVLDSILNLESAKQVISEFEKKLRSPDCIPDEECLEELKNKISEVKSIDVQIKNLAHKIDVVNRHYDEQEIKRIRRCKYHFSSEVLSSVKKLEKQLAETKIKGEVEEIDLNKVNRLRESLNQLIEVEKELRQIKKYPRDLYNTGDQNICLETLIENQKNLLFKIKSLTKLVSEEISECPVCFTKIGTKDREELKLECSKLKKENKKIKIRIESLKVKKHFSKILSLEDKVDMIPKIKERLKVQEHKVYLNSEKMFQAELEGQLKILKENADMAKDWERHLDEYSKTLTEFEQINSLKNNKQYLEDRKDRLLKDLIRNKKKYTDNARKKSRRTFYLECSKSLKKFLTIYRTNIYSSLIGIANKILEKMNLNVEVFLSEEGIIKVKEDEVDKSFPSEINLGLVNCISLALRLSFVKIINDAANNIIDFIVIDEITAFLDKRNRQNVLQMLNFLPDLGIQQILLATHDEQIMTESTSIFEITKQNGVSAVRKL